MSIYYFIIPLFAACSWYIGKAWSKRGKQWYQSLRLPDSMPPQWVYILIWPILYVLSSISYVLVVQNLYEVSQFNLIFIIFSINAVCNFFWSYIFFIRRSLLFSVVDSALVWFTALLLIFLIWPYDYRAAALLIPYAAWTTFATYMSYQVWRKNI